MSVSDTATVSSLASSTSVQTVKAANGNRQGLFLFNDSTSDAFVKYGPTASSTDFTLKMAAGSFYEIPGRYLGLITVVWTTANGSMRITELV